MNTPQLIRCAVIGVGKAGQGVSAKGGGHQIAYTHSQTVLDHPRLSLAAGADINAENLAAWREKFQVPAGYADYREMLAAEKPDLVSLCTYVGLHREMIEVCARAGVKGILCEKPFLASPADLAAVRRVIAETGVKIVVAHIRRYRPAFQRVRDLIQDGAIGQPLLFYSGIEGWDLSEWGSHWLDIFRYFNNDIPIRWVMGQARVRDTRGYGHALEECSVAYWEFENGCKGLLDGGNAVTKPYAMIMSGSEGDIRMVGEGGYVLTNASGRKEVTTANPDMKLLWRDTFDSLIAWVEGGPEPMLGATNMLKTSELNLAAYLSATQGDRIDLPLTDFSLAEWPLEAMARRNLKQ